jgi:hypothetical protein
VKSFLSWPARGSSSVDDLAPDSGGFDLVSGFAFFVEANQYQKSKGKSKNDRRKSK